MAGVTSPFRGFQMALAILSLSISQIGLADEKLADATELARKVYRETKKLCEQASFSYFAEKRIRQAECRYRNEGERILNREVLALMTTPVFSRTLAIQGVVSGSFAEAMLDFRYFSQSSALQEVVYNEGYALAVEECFPGSPIRQELFKRELERSDWQGKVAAVIANVLIFRGASSLAAGSPVARAVLTSPITQGATVAAGAGVIYAQYKLREERQQAILSQNPGYAHAKQAPDRARSEHAGDVLSEESIRRNQSATQALARLNLRWLDEQIANLKSAPELTEDQVMDLQLLEQERDKLLAELRFTAPALQVTR